jgi:uncharacterized protein DUF4255
MANYLALAAVAKTLLRLIEEQCPREEFSGTPSFVLYSSQDFSTPAVTEGFSLMMYRVTVSAVLRNQPPRRRPDGVKKRPSLPLDLSFMLTPWATEAERQLRLLGWAMRFLEDNAVLPAALLNQSLSRRERPAFDPEEAVEVYCDPPVMADYLGLWDKFKTKWQTSVTYSVRMVMIESDITMRDEALVQTRDLGFGTEQTPASP